MLPLIFLVLGVLAQQTFAEEPEAIVGGEPAAPGEFPHQVSLRLFGSHICGASIIDSLWILTASHCVYNNIFIRPPYIFLKVVTGSLSLAGGQSHSVAKVIVHEGYNGDMSQGTKNDIALIKLTAPIQFNVYQSPIPLADSEPVPGQQCTLSGWGQTSTNDNTPPSQLQKMNQAVVSTSECAQIHGVPLTNGHVCSYNNYGIGACMGDSGGPLISDGKQIGITSWGRPCGEGLPDVYTKVKFYVSWIINHISSL